MMITHEEISKRAKEIWEREGRPEGRDKEHWLAAEAELQKETLRDPSGPQLTASESPLAKSTALVASQENGNGAKKRSARRLK